MGQISNGMMMAAVRCYCYSLINKLLCTHIAMLPKFPAKKFHATVIWHMTSPARCYYDLTHMSVTQHIVCDIVNLK
jgi:hypothetical protein